MLDSNTASIRLIRWFAKSVVSLLQSFSNNWETWEAQEHIISSAATKLKKNPKLYSVLAGARVDFVGFMQKVKLQSYGYLAIKDEKAPKTHKMRQDRTLSSQNWDRRRLHSPCYYCSGYCDVAHHYPRRPLLQLPAPWTTFSAYYWKPKMLSHLLLLFKHIWSISNLNFIRRRHSYRNWLALVR